MTFFKKMNLTSRLFAISFIPTLIFALILLAIFNRGINLQKKAIGENIQLYSDVLVKSISEGFHSRYHNVQAIAKNNSLKSNNKEEITYVLNEMMTLYPDSGYMMLVSLSGELIASNTQSSDGKELNFSSIQNVNLKDQQWFKASKSQTFSEDLKKKIFGTYVDQIKKDPLAKLMYGKDVIGNHYSTIIDDGFGDVQAILTVFVRTSWIQNSLKELFKSINLKTESELAFFNKEGKLASVFNTNIHGKSEHTSPELIENSFINGNTNIGRLLNNKGKGTTQQKSIFYRSKDIYYAGSKVSGSKFIDSLGWSVLIGLPPKVIFETTHNLEIMFISSIVILLTVLSIINYLGGKLTGTPILNISNTLKNNSLTVGNVAVEVNNASVQLSKNTTEQASAVEQISSSLEEAQEMISNNTEGADKVTEFANDTYSEVIKGKEMIIGLKKSMEEIIESNSNIEKLQELISEIGTKAKIIDEIVLQTKLLSFNASVEAERAGEHGRGFAVVAQEVGNLARLSGKAATEVNDIVTNSIEQASVIISENGKKVQKGSDLSEQTSLLLDKIEEKTSHVKKQSEIIAKASKEQENSIKQINAAVSTIDQSTQEIASNSDQLANTGIEMNKQADELDKSVDSLISVIKPKNVA